MIIKYKRKMLRNNLIFGLLWSTLGILSVIFDGSNYFHFGYIIIGLFYLGSYAHQKHYNYLTLTDSSIIKNGFFSRTLLFSDINKVKYIAGEYSLFSESKKLTINKDLIEPSSLEELELAIEKIKP